MSKKAIALAVCFFGLAGLCFFIPGPGVVHADPVACFTYSCSGRTCNFDSSCSEEAGGRYGWVWGDGTNQETALTTISHTYSQAGTYKVRLTVGFHLDLNSQVQYVTVS